MIQHPQSTAHTYDAATSKIKKTYRSVYAYILIYGHNHNPIDNESTCRIATPIDLYRSTSTNHLYMQI